MLLIPAIDLREGRCVRLLQGDFDAETRYQTEPLELLSHYRSLGAVWVHVVDLDGARDGVPANRKVIAQLAAAGGVRLQVGGGIRRPETIEDLLSAGVQRVVIGSAAVERPGEVLQWVARFGAERISLALDVRVNGQGEPRVRTRGWREDGAQSLWNALGAYPRESLRHVLCTDISRDGALAGPNGPLYSEAVRRFPGIAWQASGGVRDAGDLRSLAEAGVAAAVSGKALLEQRITPEELRPFLRDASSPA